MNKDIEWLKNEILGLSIKARHKEHNQREWHMGYKMALFDVNKLIDQLDEPETLSLEWIEENKVARINDVRKMTTSVVLPVEKLKNLLVPKQDKPVIPQFVANWIESYREKTLAELINDVVYSSDEDSQCFRRWFHEEMGFESNYSEFLSRAWLDGYEVEKEKLYTVDLPHSYELIKLLHTQTYRIKNYSESGFGDYTNTFTEAEIKAIDKRYWAFAEEVAE